MCFSLFRSLRPSQSSRIHLFVPELGRFVDYPVQASTEQACLAWASSRSPKILMTDNYTLKLKQSHTIPMNTRRRTTPHGQVPSR